LKTADFGTRGATLKGGYYFRGELVKEGCHKSGKETRAADGEKPDHRSI
jgi:hypothetical protein